MHFGGVLRAVANAPVVAVQTGRMILMALIKPRTRGKQLVRHRTRLDHETNETLYAYAHFIGESTEYVLNQVIDTVLGKDKEYLQWRESHSESFVPRGEIARQSAQGGGRRRAVNTPAGA